MPPDKFEKLAEILRAIVPDLEARIDRLRSNLPDPVKRPVSNALARAYVSRLEINLDSIRKGAQGLKHEYREHPHLMNEIQELETWMLRKTTARRGAESIEEHKDEIGDWFCSEMGYSYSKTRQFLQAMGRPKRGAPSKRVETLKMMDARIVNRWSYKKLAIEMCDCESTSHTEYCKERIRKRIKELEEFLAKYQIAYTSLT